MTMSKIPVKIQLTALMDILMVIVLKILVYLKV